MLRKVVMAVALFGALAGGVSACNTAEGVGKDMQSAGEAVEEEAE
ncbi:Predicted small secreted protein [Limimonas halophila]|uniref:Predicted small secreted protein n=1 Tax=Limimonas halophila TaxID=1082479 RepID=A0A1G7L376_9PROT|nr:entericidin A/B family lipoprotein [Limimonas halophila]SDF43469.1 Predicted small secreted protein [Limimonas halophila]